MKQTTLLPEDRHELEAAFHKAQTKLLDTVDAYFGERHGLTSTEAINELLFLWLTTPSTVLTTKSTQNVLQLTLDLTSLLAELQTQLTDLTFLKDQIEKCKEEVSHE
ncbi:hypothetical protein [Spirosoma validum]|uniref:Uncharacterized protein n=1 Tax=Spirosoma validum TaxID=2771355 RepID=A0A927AZJ3_9BACT|nr:hypothetical protein [Spirosoma validum]MBD2752626.1 hypothetical protein [Spirosoma validum]